MPRVGLLANGAGRLFHSSSLERAYGELPGPVHVGLQIEGADFFADTATPFGPTEPPGHGPLVVTKKTRRSEVGCPRTPKIPPRLPMSRGTSIAYVRTAACALELERLLRG